MKYAVAIEIGNEAQAYGVVVPDLPGVFSAGDTLEEALANVEEAILMGLEGYMERGQAFPEPTDLAHLMVSRDGKSTTKKFPSKSWIWFVVDVDPSKITAKAIRVNITLPEPLLKSIDAYADRHGESRSGFLARAAQSALSH